MAYQTSYHQMHAAIESAVASYSRIQNEAQSFLASYRRMEPELSATARWCREYERSERARQASIYSAMANSTTLVRAAKALNTTRSPLLGCHSIQILARMRQQEFDFAARTSSIVNTSQIQAMQQAALLTRGYSSYISNPWRDHKPREEREEHDRSDNFAYITHPPAQIRQEQVIEASEVSADLLQSQTAVSYTNQGQPIYLFVGCKFIMSTFNNKFEASVSGVTQGENISVVNHQNNGADAVQLLTLIGQASPIIATMDEPHRSEAIELVENIRTEAANNPTFTDRLLKSAGLLSVLLATSDQGVQLAGKIMEFLRQFPL